MHSLTIDRQQVDEQMWLGREQVYDIVQYVRVLQALIGVDDKQACRDVVDDASTRKVFIFVKQNGLWNGFFGKRFCIELLPFIPHLIVPATASQKISVGLSFRASALIGENAPRMVRIGNAPKYTDKSSHKNSLSLELC